MTARTYDTLVVDLGSWVSRDQHGLQEQTLRDACRALEVRGKVLATPIPDSGHAAALRTVRRAFERALDNRRWELYRLKGDPLGVTKRQALEKQIQDLLLIVAIGESRLAGLVRKATTALPRLFRKVSET